MNASDHICATCEYWEKHFDRPNDGKCFLDCYGNELLKETRANNTCEFWLESTELGPNHF